MPCGVFTCTICMCIGVICATCVVNMIHITMYVCYSGHAVLVRYIFCTLLQALKYVHTNRATVYYSIYGVAVRACCYCFQAVKGHSL